MILLSNMIQFNQMTELWIFVPYPNRVEPPTSVSYFKRFFRIRLSKSTARSEKSKSEIENDDLLRGHLEWRQAIILGGRAKRRNTIIKFVKSKLDQSSVNTSLCVFTGWTVIFLTNLYLTTHNQSIGHSNTNIVPACAVFWLGRAVPARQDP